MESLVKSCRVMDPYRVASILRMYGCGLSSQSVVEDAGIDAFSRIAQETETSEQTKYRNEVRSFSLVRDAKTGTIVLKDFFTGNGVGVLVEDSPPETTVFEWRTRIDQKVMFPLHWHNVGEVILQLQGESFVWGRDIEREFWYTNLQPGRHIVIDRCAAHAATMSGRFVVGFSPKHEMSISDGQLPDLYYELFGDDHG